MLLCPGLHCYYYGSVVSLTCTFGNSGRHMCERLIRPRVSLPDKGQNVPLPVHSVIFCALRVCLEKSLTTESTESTEALKDNRSIQGISIEYSVDHCARRGRRGLILLQRAHGLLRIVDVENWSH